MTNTDLRPSATKHRTRTMRTVPKLRMVITIIMMPPSTEDYPDEAIILSPSGRYRSTPCDC